MRLTSDIPCSRLLKMTAHAQVDACDFHAGLLVILGIGKMTIVSRLAKKGRFPLRALLPCPLPDAGDGDGLAGAGIS